jgi:hypothetical protein
MAHGTMVLLGAILVGLFLYHLFQEHGPGMEGDDDTPV